MGTVWNTKVNQARSVFNITTRSLSIPQQGAVVPVGWPYFQKRVETNENPLKEPRMLIFASRPIQPRLDPLAFQILRMYIVIS